MLEPEDEGTDFHLPGEISELTLPNPCRSVTDPGKRIAKRVCGVPMEGAAGRTELGSSPPLGGSDTPLRSPSRAVLDFNR